MAEKKPKNYPMICNSEGWPSPEPLKTLKDIGSQYISLPLPPKFYIDLEKGTIRNDREKSLITKLELRQEAIKWIKQLQTEQFGANLNKAKIGWIKHFFNIREEELE